MVKWRRFLCVGVCGALLLGMLAGCADDPSQPTSTPAETPDAEDMAYQLAGISRDTVLFTADGEAVTADDYLYWLLSAIAMTKGNGYLADDAAWEETIDDVNTTEYLKQNALESSKLYAVALARANEEGITLTQEDQDSIQSQMDSMETMLESYYGITMQEYLDQQCISLAGYRKVSLEIPMLVEKLQSKYSEAGELDPTEEAMQSMIEQEGIYSCKHILLAFPENEDGSETTDEQKAAVKAQADALLAELQSADNPVAAFETAMQEKSEDTRDPETGELYKPEGYTFYSDGYMVDGSSALASAFVQAGMAVGEGQLSQPVETNYGYHILLGQSADNEETRAAYPNYRMNQYFNQWMEEAEVDTTAAYDLLDPKSFYDNMIEMLQRWQEEQLAEQEAQASASPETESTQPTSTPAA